MLTGPIVRPIESRKDRADRPPSPVVIQRPDGSGTSTTFSPRPLLPPPPVLQSGGASEAIVIGSESTLTTPLVFHPCNSIQAELLLRYSPLVQGGRSANAQREKNIVHRPVLGQQDLPIYQVNINL